MNELEHEGAMALWRASQAARAHDHRRCPWCRAVRRRRMWGRIRFVSKWAFIGILPALLLLARIHVT